MLKKQNPLKKASFSCVGLAKSARRISSFHRFINCFKDLRDSCCLSKFWL